MNTKADVASSLAVVPLTFGRWLDSVLFVVLRIAGLLVLSAAVLKIWRWPDPGSLELLPLFSLPVVWACVAVVETTAGIWILLAQARRTTLIVATLISSLFLVVNAYLYFSNHRDCPCLGDLRLGTLGMATGELVLLTACFLLAGRNTGEIGVGKLLICLLVGITLGAATVAAGSSDDVFSSAGTLDSRLSRGNRLGSSALLAGSALAGSPHTVEIEVIADREPVLVTGYKFLGAHAADDLPFLVPANSRRKITLKYRTISRSGKYLLPGNLFTNRDRPGTNSFFISGETRSK